MNTQNIRTGSSVAEIKQAFRENLRSGMGRIERVASRHDLYLALAMAVRDRVLARAAETMETYGGSGCAARGLSLGRISARAASRE